MGAPNLPGSWEQLVGDLVSALGDEFEHRNDPSRWTAEIEKGADAAHTQTENASVETVSLDIGGFSIKVKTAAGESTWHASPGPNGHPITFQSATHNEANLIFRPVPSPGNPGRFHLDIRWVSSGGEVIRLDSQFPNKA